MRGQRSEKSGVYRRPVWQFRRPTTVQQTKGSAGGMKAIFSYLNRGRMNLTARLPILRRQEGQGMAEYGIVIALVAIVAAVGFKFLGEKLLEFIQTKVVPLLFG